jgi:hypothetical protein
VYYPMDAAGLVRAEWGFDAPAERPVVARPHRVRRAYARVWWAARPRFDGSSARRTPAVARWA